jgi:hypothetical protein
MPNFSFQDLIVSISHSLPLQQFQFNAQLHSPGTSLMHLNVVALLLSLLTAHTYSFSRGLERIEPFLLGIHSSEYRWPSNTESLTNDSDILSKLFIPGPQRSHLLCQYLVTSAQPKDGLLRADGVSS